MDGDPWVTLSVHTMVGRFENAGNFARVNLLSLQDPLKEYQHSSSMKFPNTSNPKKD